MSAGGQRGRMRAAPRGWWEALPVWRRVTAGALAAGLAATVGGLLAWPSSSSGTAPQARGYLESFTACLLTGSRGLAAAQTALLWRGMQDASLATQAKVEYLPVMSGSTTAAALPYLASLVERHCNVVVAAGGAEVAVVSAQASRFPSVQFVVPGPAAAGSHVIGLRGPPSALPDAVASVISTAMRRSA
jgi:hypothetical protein